MTPEKREALTWVRNALDPSHPEPMPEWMKFDMYSWISPIGCRTACCIGGSAEIHLNGLAGPEEPVHPLGAQFVLGWQSMKDPNDDALWRLFYEWPPGQPSRERAAKAIDAYLSGIEFPWSDQ